MKYLPALFATMGNLGLLLVAVDLLPFGVRGLAALILVTNVTGFIWGVMMITGVYKALTKAGMVHD